jgi:SAM-dependent MidA family methyltransferase
VELIREAIAAAPGERITFARFMALALTAPGLGYYATSRERPTRHGDFLTAPELHPFFGHCVGRQLHEVWERLDEPRPFVVREYGAGRGTLAATVIHGLQSDGSGLAESIDWQTVDLPDGWLTRPSVAPIVGTVLANEFLDALPVHRMAMRDGMLMERYVAWGDGALHEIEGPPSSSALAAQLDADGVVLANDQVAEVCLDAPAWVDRAAHDLERGVLLITDYGHPAAELYGPRRMAGTLMTYRGQQVGTDPFLAAGQQDITAHVDVTAVERAAFEAGLDGLGSTTQGPFLVRLGLGELLRDLGTNPATPPDAYMLARASVARLLDPRHLGGFRVLAFGRDVPADPPLRGFADAAR